MPAAVFGLFGVLAWSTERAFEPRLIFETEVDEAVYASAPFTIEGPATSVDLTLSTAVEPRAALVNEDTGATLLVTGGDHARLGPIEPGRYWVRVSDPAREEPARLTLRRAHGRFWLLLGLACLLMALPFFARARRRGRAAFAYAALGALVLLGYLAASASAVEPESVLVTRRAMPNGTRQPDGTFAPPPGFFEP